MHRARDLAWANIVIFSSRGVGTAQLCQVHPTMHWSINIQDACTSQTRGGNASRRERAAHRISPPSTRRRLHRDACSVRPCFRLTDVQGKWHRLLPAASSLSLRKIFSSSRVVSKGREEWADPHRVTQILLGTDTFRQGHSFLIVPCENFVADGVTTRCLCNTVLLIITREGRALLPRGAMN